MRSRRLAMANELAINLSAAIEAKLAKNEQEYPADEYRARFGPDDANPAGR